MQIARRIVLLAAFGLVLGCGLWSNRSDSESPARLDLNHAPARRIETLPGITPTLARRIVEGRPYDDVEQLVARGILSRRELERIEDRVMVQEPERAR